jgi:hypothetical protein
MFIKLTALQELHACQVKQEWEETAGRLSKAHGAEAELLETKLGSLRVQAAQADVDVAAATLECVSAEEHGRAAVKTHHWYVLQFSSCSAQLVVHAQT